MCERASTMYGCGSNKCGVKGGVLDVACNISLISDASPCLTISSVLPVVVERTDNPHGRIHQISAG